MHVIVTEREDMIDSDEDESACSRGEGGRQGERTLEPEGSGRSAVDAACIFSAGQPSYGSYARSIVEGRARIRRYLSSELFSDPAFDMILDLYASEEEGLKPTVGSVAKAARVPATTGLRYVAALEKEGFLERRTDPLDKRRVLLKLLPAAKEAMRLYLEDISSIPLRR